MPHGVYVSLTCTGSDVTRPHTLHPGDGQSSLPKSCVSYAKCAKQVAVGELWRWTHLSVNKLDGNETDGIFQTHYSPNLFYH